MATITTASNQWAKRPADERFTSLLDMSEHFRHIRDNSRSLVVSNRKLLLEPTTDGKDLVVSGPNGCPHEMTHWSFGQLSNLAGAPAGFVRTLPAPLAADVVNFKLHYDRDVEDVGVLLYKNGGAPLFRAATGPNYGRIWNSEIVDALVERFGDGINGQFRVPGEFGKAVEVTKSNTTLYASDRDMFVFLADEQNRVEIPNRRNGESGSMARGFYVWNSETGSSTFGIAGFLFDYVCQNRIIWGAEEFREIRIRHTAGAPDRYIEEVQPVIEAYANSSASTITQAIANAQAEKINDVDKFLASRFSRRMGEAIKAAHMADEGRPIETLWDATTGITAYARGVKWQDDRVALERQGGEILALAA